MMRLLACCLALCASCSNHWQGDPHYRSRAYKDAVRVYENELEGKKFRRGSEKARFRLAMSYLGSGIRDRYAKAGKILRALAAQPASNEYVLSARVLVRVLDVVLAQEGQLEHKRIAGEKTHGALTQAQAELKALRTQIAARQTANARENAKLNATIAEQEKLIQDLQRQLAALKRIDMRKRP